MTLTAIGSEAALVIAVLMTGDAFGGCVLEGWCAVTLLAGHEAMQTYQRKMGQIVIEIDLLPPAGLIMTCLTLGSQLPLMRVVLCVAGGAGRRQLVAIEVALVAGTAFNLPMSAAERKLRLPVVIEMDYDPFLRAMAVIAFHAIAPAMHILQLMTVTANRADAFIALSGVTSVTGDFCMCPR